MTETERRTRERRAYQRGYAAGRRNEWPGYLPPTPPDELVAAVISAACKLRNAVDGECAKFGEDDEIALLLWPICDEVTEALENIAEYAATSVEEVGPPVTIPVTRPA